MQGALWMKVAKTQIFSIVIRLKSNRNYRIAEIRSNVTLDTEFEFSSIEILGKRKNFESSALRREIATAYVT